MSKCINILKIVFCFFYLPCSHVYADVYKHADNNNKITYNDHTSVTSTKISASDNTNNRLTDVTYSNNTLSNQSTSSTNSAESGSVARQLVPDTAAINRSNMLGQKTEMFVDSKGVLLRDGLPYRAIGVNYFSALYRTIMNPADTSYNKGFQELSRYKVPFVRVMLGGFWPSELKLYKDNPAKYFKIVDAFFDAAEKNNIGIIASLHWNKAAAPDLVGEPVSFIGKPNSKTREFMSAYTHDMVHRYGHRRVVWAWEFGNEASLYADLPIASLSRPQTNVSKGTPVLRNQLDELTSADVLFAYRDFANTVKAIHPASILSTGNALPRRYAYHNTVYKGSLKQWGSDSEAEFCKVLQRDNPEGFDLVSVHIYPNEKDGYFGAKSMDYSRVITVAGECAKMSGKALFIGEFGVDSTKYVGERAREKSEFNRIVSVIENSGAALSALWVYDFSFQADSFNVTSSSDRKYQLDAIKSANNRLKFKAP